MATALSSSYRARIADGQLGGERPSTSYPVPPPSTLCHRRRCWHATNVPERRTTACSVSSSGRVADPVYMQEYQKLKDNTITVARQAGGGLALYLLLVVDGEAGLCALIGSAACNLYLAWLFYDVDAVNVETKIPLWEAERIESGLGRGIAKVFAAYQHALRPRLLVLVALAGLTALWNQVSGAPLDTAHQGFLLLGFLAYKVPLVLKIADDNVSKSYKDDEMSRPLIDSFDDNLDQWGRPKKQIVPLPTEALPDNIDTSNVDLEKLGSWGGMMEMMGFQQQRKHTHGSAEEAQAAAADKK